MKKYKCRFCENEFEFEKQVQFASHSATCKSNPYVINNIKGQLNKERNELKNPKKEYSFNCKKCTKEYKLVLKLTEFLKEKYSKHCSAFCSHSRVRTDEQKLKISTSVKNSEKAKIANTDINKIEQRIKSFRETRKNKTGKESVIYSVSFVNNKRVTLYKNGVCMLCKKDIVAKWSRESQYHKECWLQISGGLKEGSSRGKNGWYKGYWCDSSYELAWVIYSLDHNIKFERNKKGFEYEYEGKVLKYYPDFILEDGSYLEVKNYKSLLTDAKIKNFPHTIKVLYKDDLKNIFEYVIAKYSKDFIKLYENNLL